jgi:hypothetical protein
MKTIYKGAKNSFGNSFLGIEDTETITCTD